MAIGSLGSTQYNKFVEFATSQMQSGNSKAVARFGAEGPLGNRTLRAADSRQDWVGHFRRNQDEMTLNDNVRTIFRDTIANMFGGIDHVPESVKKVMLMDDYNQGKPLTARRIAKVKVEVDKFAARFQLAIDAAKTKLDQTFGEESRFIVADEALANGTNRVTRDQLHELASVALRRVVADKDALDVVTKSINTIIMGGDSKFRSAEGIAKRVDDILANIVELRTAAKGDRAVIEAGKNMLVARGKSVPQGLFARMVDAALKMKTGDVLKISPSSSGLQFHRAVARFADNINGAMNKSGAINLLVGGEEQETGRAFFADLHFAKCSASTLNRMRNALNSDTALQLATVYSAISNEDINAGNDLTDNFREHVIEQSDAFTQIMGHLKTGVDVRCGVPANEMGKGGLFKGEFDYEDVDAVEVLDDLKVRARNATEQTRREFLANCVNGNGRGADIMRGIYSRKIGMDIGNPAAELTQEMSSNSKTIIGWAIMSDCKKFAAGKAEDTAFFKDINRKLDIRLPNDVKLSTDFETARDQIASFITRGAKTTYASLDAKEKAKSHVVMSLLTQEISKAAFSGATIALHPTGSGEPFLAPRGIATVGEQPRNSYTYKLSLTDVGELKLEFHGKQAVDIIAPGDTDLFNFATTDVGPGSVLEARTVLSITSRELDRLSELDYSKFDGTAAKRLFESNEENKMEKIGNTFPAEYKLGNTFECTTSFIATLN